MFHGSITNGRLLSEADDTFLSVPMMNMSYTKMLVIVHSGDVKITRRQVFKKMSKRQKKAGNQEHSLTLKDYHLLYLDY